VDGENYIAKCFKKLKVKQFHYRPGVAQRVPGNLCIILKKW
jgi:hypothetical protein